MSTAPIAVVTGSSRGAGHGIAVGLGRHGCTVYVTGRSADPTKAYLLDITESPEFTGEVIWALFSDPKLAELSGQTVIGAEMAVKYGVKDVGGRQPPSYRDTYQVAPRIQYSRIIR